MNTSANNPTGRVFLQGGPSAVIQSYFKNLYQRTMHQAYGRAEQDIFDALREGGNCLDCGAGSGGKFALLQREIGMSADRYCGLEWHAASVAEAQRRDINVAQADLNKKLLHPNESFQCVFGLSVLEHLLNPCHYLRECKRVLRPGGRLIILTPNISTYFTAALILFGKMPSSGPHPDSDALLQREELFRVSDASLQHDTETDTPVHRHLIVFSYRVLRGYLQMLGFENVRGYGFGLYPFPNFMQPVLERIDPYHCHQMVFVAQK